MSADIVVAWSLMTGKAFEMGIRYVAVRSFLVDKSRVVVFLCSGARGMSVASGCKTMMSRGALGM
jgi:hypothetical protein